MQDDELKGSPLMSRASPAPGQSRTFGRTASCAAVQTAGTCGYTLMVVPTGVLPRELRRVIIPQVFIPLTDELLYEYPDLISGPVVPYVVGTPCYHWLFVELNPEESTPPRKPVRDWNQSLQLPIAAEATRATVHSF